MKISILHPSRSRADMAFNTYQKWTSTLSNLYDIEYILSLDIDDMSLIKYAELFSKENKVLLLINNNKTAIEAINIAAKKSSGDLIVVVSDDFDCFQDWDKWLVDQLKDKSDYVVKTSDGNQPFIITLPIMDRLYYNRFGYIYYPGYHHMYCDTELSCVGYLLGKIVTLTNGKVFRHRHYSVGGMQKDSINIKNDSTYHQGGTLFNERFKNNFGLTQPLNELPIDWYNLSL